MRPAYRFREGVSASPVVVCGRKFCTSCGRWRHVVDFSVKYRDPFTLNQHCRACVRVRLRNRDAKARARRNEYNRIYLEGQRRKRGVPVRNLTRTAPPDPARRSDLHRRVETEPLRPHVAAWLRAYAAAHPFDRGFAVNRGVSALAGASTVPERRIYGIVMGETARTHYAVADRLAVAIGLSLTTIYDSA